MLLRVPSRIVYDWGAVDQLHAALSTISATYGLEPPLQRFALPSSGLNNHTTGLRTGCGEYVLKLYRAPMDEPSLDYEHALLRRAADAGLSFAVPAPLPARDGAFKVLTAGGWAVLTPFLRGSCPEFRLDNGRRPPRALAEAEALGAAIAELHVALAGDPPVPRPGHTLFDALFQFPPSSRAPLTLTPEQAGFPNRAPFRELLAWWRAEAAELAAFVDGRYTLLPRQICHNDMSPANMLVAGGQITAVLDWEFATVAPRALDVAMGLRLVMQVWDDRAPWEYVARLAGGYNRYTRMTDAELAALPELLRLRNTIPGLWWLGGGGAGGNTEHFHRRMLAMQQLSAWLRENGERVIDTFAIHE